eukprot:429068-Pleurochrysis_carterae.AAC.2
MSLWLTSHVLATDTHPIIARISNTTNARAYLHQHPSVASAISVQFWAFHQGVSPQDSKRASEMTAMDGYLRWTT